MNSTQLKKGAALLNVFALLFTAAGLQFNWGGAAASVAILLLILSPILWIIFGLVAKAPVTTKLINVGLALATWVALISSVGNPIGYLIAAALVLTFFLLKRI